MKLDIVRAWKDEEYRKGLSTEDLAQLPENPAGAFELSEAELDTVQGAGKSHGDKKFVATNAVICLQTVILAFCSSLGKDCQ